MNMSHALCMTLTQTAPHTPMQWCNIMCVLFTYTVSFTLTSPCQVCKLGQLFHSLGLARYRLTPPPTLFINPGTPLINPISQPNPPPTLDPTLSNPKSCHKCHSPAT